MTQPTSALLSKLPLEIRIVIWSWSIGRHFYRVKAHQGKQRCRRVEPTTWTESYTEEEPWGQCTHIYEPTIDQGDDDEHEPTIDQGDDDEHWTSIINMVVVCRQFYHEVSETFFANNVFLFIELDNYMRYTANFGLPHSENIRHVIFAPNFTSVRNHGHTRHTWLIEQHRLGFKSVTKYMNKDGELGIVHWTWDAAFQKLSAFKNLRVLQVFVLDTMWFNESIYEGLREGLSALQLTAFTVEVYLPIGVSTQSESDTEEYSWSFYSSLDKEPIVKLQDELKRLGMESRAIVFRGGIILERPATSGRSSVDSVETLP